MSNKNYTIELFEPITNNLTEIFGLPHNSKDDLEKVLTRIEDAVNQLDHTYYGVSAEMNSLSVIRAMIIGKICNYVKGTLLHGAWTSWAEEHFTEGLRTLEKYMAITSYEPAVAGYAHLGTEKVHQLTRLVGRLERGTSFEDAFSDTDQNTRFENYTSKGFERAIAAIINKQELKESNIEVNNGTLKTLTENFSLIKNNRNVLTRLMEAKSEDADLEKTVMNIIANGGKKRSVKKELSAPRKQDDMTYVVELFITNFQRALDDPDEIRNIDPQRIGFIGRLLEEFGQLISQTNQ